MRIGSLFSGYGGLDLAALELFPGSQLWWHCEYDDAPARILEHHWPGVPNYRDVTQIDWEQLPTVDVLTGGYPCQPFSAAGRRQGTDDERHLWPHVRQAIRVLRPRFTLLENVAGHRSLGFDRVLGDLAEDGLHVRWTSLRASDIGACHHRERVFILVSDADRLRRRGRTVQLGGTPEHASWDSSDAADAGGVGRRSEPQQPSGSDPTLTGVGGHRLPLPDTTGDGPPRLDDSPSSAQARRGGERDAGGNVGAPPIRLLPTPEAKLGSSGPDYARVNREGSGGHDLATAIAVQADWGKYRAAVDRHARVLGRPAPAPARPNKNGNPKLSDEFVEWMQMLPAGWFTDPAIGLSWNDGLRAGGNGVVPPQAIAAFRELLSWSVAA